MLEVLHGNLRRALRLLRPALVGPRDPLISHARRHEANSAAPAARLPVAAHLPRSCATYDRPSSCRSRQRCLARVRQLARRLDPRVASWHSLILSGYTAEQIRYPLKGMSPCPEDS